MFVTPERSTRWVARTSRTRCSPTVRRTCSSRLPKATARAWRRSSPTWTATDLRRRRTGVDPRRAVQTVDRTGHDAGPRPADRLAVARGLVRAVRQPARNTEAYGLVTALR